MMASVGGSKYLLILPMPGRLHVSLREAQQRILSQRWDLVHSICEPNFLVVATFDVSDENLPLFKIALRSVLSSYFESRRGSGLYCSFRGMLLFEESMIYARLNGGIEDINALRDCLTAACGSSMRSDGRLYLPHVRLFGPTLPSTESVSSIITDHESMFLGSGVIHQVHLRGSGGITDLGDVVSVYTM